MLEPSGAVVPISCTVCAIWFTVIDTFDPLTLPCAVPTPEQMLASARPPLRLLPDWVKNPASVRIRLFVFSSTICQFRARGIAEFPGLLLPPPHPVSATAASANPGSQLFMGES